MRDEVDSVGRALVLRAYRSVVASASNPRGQFEAAVACYSEMNPDVPAEVARRTVAYIVATAGDMSPGSELTVY